MPPSNQSGNNVKKGTSTLSKKVKAAKDNASATNSNEDEVKYRVAVDTARRNLRNDENVSEREFKDAIDNELKRMGASKKGSDIRGETGFSQALDSLRGFIDDATLAGGNAIDGFADFALGGIAEALMGKEAADSLRNSFDGEQMQGLVDVAIDAGLASLGPAGWGLMLGKNAVQQSDNIMTALGGKDRVTMEDLDEGSALANGIEGLGGLALSAVPVAGKVRNLFSKEAGSVAKGLAQNKINGPVTNEEVSDVLGNMRSPLRLPSAADKAVANARTANKMADGNFGKGVFAGIKKPQGKHAKNQSEGKHTYKSDDVTGQDDDGLPSRAIMALGRSAAGSLPVPIGIHMAKSANDGEKLPDKEIGLPMGLAGAVAALGSKGRVSPRGYRSVPGRIGTTAALGIAGGAKQADRAYDRQPKGDGVSDEKILEYLKVR